MVEPLRVAPRGRPRRVLRLAAAAAAVALLTGAVATGARAQAGPTPTTAPGQPVPGQPATAPTTPPPVIDPSAPEADPATLLHGQRILAEIADDPEIADLSAAVGRLEHGWELTRRQQAADVAHAALARATALTATAKTNADVTEKARQRAASDVTEMAVDAYVNGGTSRLVTSPLSPEHALDAAHQSTIYDAAQTQLTARHEAAVRAAETATGAFLLASNELARARDAVERADADLEAWKATPPRTGSPLLRGPAQLRPQDVARWTRVVKSGGRALTMPLDDFARMFFDEAQKRGLRGDLLWMQSMVETGAFTSAGAKSNNFAGVGACDSCDGGMRFADAHAGVVAQLDLLVQLTTGVADPTLRSLTGRWATDPQYDRKIVATYLDAATWISANPAPA